MNDETFARAVSALGVLFLLLLLSCFAAIAVEIWREALR